MPLFSYITDLQGNHLALVRAIPAPDGGNGTFAGVELNGARTAKVRIAAWDTTAVRAIQARPLSRMLKVYYRPPGVAHAKLVVWAVIQRPVASMGGRVIEVSAVDATARAKRAFASFYGPPGIDGKVRVDGTGIELTWAKLLTTARSIGAPDPGVLPEGGRHGTPHPGTEFAISEGASFGDLIDTISDAADGPDWDLKPVDRFRDEVPSGISEDLWETLKELEVANPIYTQLHTYDRKGNDLRDLIHFGFGTGPDNLADLEVEVAGDQTANVSIVGVTGGSKEEPIRGLAASPPSIFGVGLYVSSTSLSVDEGTGNREALAQGTANTQIAVYSNAPVFLTLTVKKDELARFYPFHSFEHGDIITVSGESGNILIPYRGEWVKEVPARVSAIGLTEDAQGRVQQTLTVLVDYGDDSPEEG